MYGLSELWVHRFMDQAKTISAWSKDPSTKVGAVLVRPNKSIASSGFNGFPPGIKDTEERLNNRSLKYPIIRHAEANCLDFCLEQITSEHILFVYPFFPCSTCMGQIITRGIKKIVYYRDLTDEEKERWGENFDLSKEMFKEAGGESTNYINHIKEKWILK